MNVTLRQIRAFVAVAETGRFALAAERLHVTPSALSMLIREIETQLDLRLFDRHTRMVQLTEAGAAFLPVAQRTCADLDEAVTASRALATLKRGRVSVATSTVFAATLMPWAARAFTQRHPDIRFILADVAEQSIRDEVKSGRVDFGLGTVLDADAELRELPLWSDRLTAILGERHPLAAKRSVTWRELADSPQVMLDRGSPLRALVERAFAQAGVTVRPAFEVSFSSTVISMVAADLGVAALPVNARQLSPRVKVLVRPIVRPVVERRVCLLTRRGVALTPAADAFRLFLEDYVRGGGYC